MHKNSVFFTNYLFSSPFFDTNLRYINFNIHFNEGYSHVAFLLDEHIYYF